MKSSDVIRREIKSKQGYLEITNKKIAKLTGLNEKTVGKHINNPELMTLGEYRLLVKILNLPPDGVNAFLYE